MKIYNGYLRNIALAIFFSLTAASLSLYGCGGGGGDTPTPPPANTYSISGVVSGAVTQGVTINLTGAATANTTTDASGNYSFSGLTNGSYTVTPTKTGYTFSPISSAVSVSGTNVSGKNFTATANTIVPLHTLGYDNVQAALQGQPFARQLPATGGNPPYTWRLVSGTPPSGLSLSDKGLISGTPTSTGAFIYTLRLTDSEGTWVENTYTQNVYATAGTISFVLKVPEIPEFGQYQHVGFTPFIQGGTLPWTFTITGLPNGVTFDPTTGLIYGTPTSAFAGVITIILKDANGNEAIGSPVTVPFQVNAPGTSAAPVNVTATAGDGQVIVSWTAATGATSYNIYWSTTPGVTKTSGTKITGATSPYTHTGRTNGTTYYYVVTALYSSGESGVSIQVSVVPQGSGPVSYQFWKGSSREFYYVLNFNGERALKVTGIPFMVVKYDNITLFILDCEFGLSEVTQEYIPGLVHPAPEVTIPATSVDYHSQLNLQGSVVVPVDWTSPYYLGKSSIIGALGQPVKIDSLSVFSFQVPDSIRRVYLTQWTFTQGSRFMNGGVKNIDNVMFLGIDADPTNAFHLNAL